MFHSSTDSFGTLRAQLHEIVGTGHADTLSVGLTSIDAALPNGGLTRAALHEIAYPTSGTSAAVAYTAFLVGRLIAKTAQPVLWVTRHEELYPPGLHQLGLPTQRLLLAHCRTHHEALWAVEQGLQCDALAGVVGHTRPLAFIWTQRLHLAARRNTHMLLLVQPEAHSPRTTAAQTCWRVTTAPSTPAPGSGPGDPVWQVDLLRCRGGRPQSWTVQFDRRHRCLAEGPPHGMHRIPQLEHVA